MARLLILAACLTALALSTVSCHLPCREPFWKKPKSQACEEVKPAW
jgi:hypothetical protein